MEESVLVPLTPLTMAILLALAEKDLHGYALMEEVAAQTEGALNPGTGSLYAALHRLEQAGYAEQVEGMANDDEASRRRYFRITSRGRDAAAAEARRMMKVVEIAREQSLVPIHPSLRGAR